MLATYLSPTGVPFPSRSEVARALGLTPLSRAESYRVHGKARRSTPSAEADSVPLGWVASAKDVSSTMSARRPQQRGLGVARWEESKGLEDEVEGEDDEEDDEVGGEEGDEEDDEEGKVTWIQCSECDKWRALDPHHPSTRRVDMSLRWTCAQNSDARHNSCVHPEAAAAGVGDARGFAQLSTAVASRCAEVGGDAGELLVGWEAVAAHEEGTRRESFYAPWGTRFESVGAVLAYLQLEQDAELGGEQSGGQDDERWGAEAGSRQLRWDDLALGDIVEAKYRAVAGGRQLHAGEVVACEGEGYFTIRYFPDAALQRGLGGQPRLGDADNLIERRGDHMNTANTANTANTTIPNPPSRLLTQGPLLTRVRRTCVCP